MPTLTAAEYTLLSPDPGPPLINWYKELEDAVRGVSRATLDEQFWREAIDLEFILHGAKLGFTALCGSITDIERLAEADAQDPSLRLAAIDTLARQVLQEHGGRVAERYPDLGRPKDDYEVFTEIREIVGRSSAPLDWSEMLRKAAHDATRMLTDDSPLANRLGRVLPEASKTAAALVDVLADIVALVASEHAETDSKIKMILDKVRTIVEQHCECVRPYNLDERPSRFSWGSAIAWDLAVLIAKRKKGLPTWAGVAFCKKIVHDKPNFSEAVSHIVSRPFPGLVIVPTESLLPAITSPTPGFTGVARSS